MQGLRRKVVYVTLYELIAIAISSTGLAAGSGASLERASVIAVVTSLIAVVWNLVYNTLFERWEARQSVRGRGLARRVAHAVGFELGFLVLLVPLFAWWFGISLQHALVLEVGLALFFLLYTFVFNWAFDKVFGLPASALPLQVAGGGASSR
ncbi:PACE efflux transporter [Hydrogenophaga luteola]|uniref:PACE efflux transporter n=1 Tax=Hydrogenophaga luteola TaxID=1591122 RepID=A0ABV7W0C1_9BURK